MTTKTKSTAKKSAKTTAKKLAKPAARKPPKPITARRLSIPKKVFVAIDDALPYRIDMDKIDHLHVAAGVLVEVRRGLAQGSVVGLDDEYWDNLDEIYDVTIDLLKMPQYSGITESEAAAFAAVAEKYPEETRKYLRAQVKYVWDDYFASLDV